MARAIFRLLDNTSNVVTNESKLVWPSLDGLCERELAVAIGLVDFLVEYQNGKLVLIDGAQRTVDVSPAITIVLFALLSLLGDLFSDWDGFEVLVAMIEIHHLVVNNTEENF